MEHPDNGMIRSVLDAEEPGRQDQVRRHLEECRVCGDAAEAQTRSWRMASLSAIASWSGFRPSSARIDS